MWYSNGESELSLLDSLALGFYSDAEFFSFIIKTFIYKEKSKFFHKDSWSHIYGDLCGQKLSCLQIKRWQFIVSSEET